MKRMLTISYQLMEYYFSHKLFRHFSLHQQKLITSI